MSLLYGPDGRPINLATAEIPKLFDAKAEPVRRKLTAEDISGLDPSKAQYIYGRTADGKTATHGNDYTFFAHELDPVKMKEVDPAVVLIATTEPQELVRRPVLPAIKEKLAERHSTAPRNRHERRRAEKLAARRG